MSQFFLWLVVLVEGFITISAEILTLRQMLPIAGSSVVVTSLIIGIFLLFLAYGYRRGGQIKFSRIDTLKRNFTFSAFWLGIGLSYIFIHLFFSVLHSLFNTHLLISLTLYLLIVTAPLVYVLGQTVPITMNLIRQSPTTGETGGKILHLSTIGSFLGAILTSLVLMNFVGVAWTITINYFLLMVLTLILIQKPNHEDQLRIVALIVGLCITYLFNNVIEKKIFIHTNAYANYQVFQDKNQKVLITNESFSSFIDQDKKAFPYIELIKKILFKDLKFTNKDILALGAGGFTLSAESTFNNRFTYVDIDKDIKSVVTQHFLSSINSDLIIDDARDYLNITPKKFDAIISDVYSNAKSIPAHLLTQEFFQLLNLHLNDSGVAIINIVGRPMLDDDYSRKVDNTIRSVFPQCMVIPLDYTEVSGNILYVCKKNLEFKEEGLYTDDLNQSPLDFFKLLIFKGK